MKLLSPFSVGLLILFTIVLVIGVVNTIRVGQSQGQNRKSEFDSDLNDVVEAHPYTRNPIFWVYIFGLGLAFLYIFYNMI